MAVHKPVYTAEQFEKIANLPENAEKILELIAGEMYEVPSHPRSSNVGSRFSYFIQDYLMERDIGYVTGEAGGYIISEEDRFAPDVAFISRERQPELPEQGYNPIAPDLAVEVVSPSDDMARLMYKKDRYLANGTRLVWIVYLKRREVEVYAPGQPMRIVGIDGILDGGDVLPGFKLPLRSIFPN